MRNVPFVVSFLCGMVLAIHTGVSQTNPNNSNDGAPFGGAKVSVGSVNVEPAGPGPAAPSGSSSVCVTIRQSRPVCADRPVQSLPEQHQRSRVQSGRLQHSVDLRLGVFLSTHNQSCAHAAQRF